MTWRMAIVLLACGALLSGCARKPPGLGFGARVETAKPVNTKPGPARCGVECRTFLNR